MAIHDLVVSQSSTHGHLHAKSIRTNVLWGYPKAPISKKYHTSTTNWVAGIEPNPTKSLISNFQYAAISISKKKQSNFHKNKRKLKENIPTRRRVSPDTARAMHEWKKKMTRGDVKRAIVWVLKKTYLHTIALWLSLLIKEGCLTKLSSLGCLPTRNNRWQRQRSSVTQNRRS